MPAKIVSDEVLIRDLSSEEDIFFHKNCQVFANVESHGTICIAGNVNFFGCVKAKNIVITGDVDVKFFKTLSCEEFETSGPVHVGGRLDVLKKITYNGKEFNCGEFILAGQPTVPVVGAKEYPRPSGFILFQEPFLTMPLCPKCKLSFVTKPLAGFCDTCLTETAIQPAELVIQDEHREPTAWEIAHMTDEEKEFYAHNGYVTFDERMPDEPYVCIRQESKDGELIYKEIVVADPQARYLHPDEGDLHRSKIRYNGGPFAWMIHGTASASSLFCLSLLTPFLGPAGVLVSWAASIPFTWKMSKKAANMINDKVVLPHEMEARRELVNGRRRDEKTRQDVYIETI